MGSQNTESLKLIGMHNKRIISIYNSALKYFKDDVSLWKEYIHFLIEAVSNLFYLLNYFTIKFYIT